MYRINRNTPLTIERVEKYIELHKSEYLPKLIKNKSYFDCKNTTIMNRSFADTTKPNNRIASPFAQYITTLVCGYFMGKPVTITSQNEALQQVITQNNNHDRMHNALIAKDASVYGLGAELLYINALGKIAYERLDVLTLIPIYSTDIDSELLYTIRYWEDKDIVSEETATIIEVYTKEETYYYRQTEKGTMLTGSAPNYFGMIPVNIFMNNRDIQGDFEKVISLIDCYDLALSDTANFRQELNDSYLVFKNTNLETEDIITMKEKRVIQIEDAEQGLQSDVSWLNKDSNDTENENFKTRLADDIKRFSYVADIEGAKSHTSATSAKIGLLGIEQVCTQKEAEFRGALVRRLGLICNFLKTIGEEVTTEDITITFVRNIPIDVSVITDTIQKLRGLVSDKTLIEQLDFVNDVEAEMARIKEQNALNSYDLLGGEVTNADEQRVLAEAHYQ